MTESSTLSKKILERIKKLLALSEGAREIGSTHEAETAAAKATKLLLDYKLTISDLSADIQEDTDPMGTTKFDPRDYNLKLNKARIEWKETLGDIVAHYTFCVQLVTPKYTIRWFVGRASDREIAVYLYAFLVRSIETAAQKGYDRLYARAEYYGTQREMVGWKSGFIEGAVEGVMAKMERERQQTVVDYRNQETALAVVQKSTQDVQDYMDEQRKSKDLSKSTNTPLTTLKAPKGSELGKEAGYRYGLALEAPKAMGTQNVKQQTKQLV